MIDDGTGAPVCSQLAVFRMCRGTQPLFSSGPQEDDADCRRVFGNFVMIQTITYTECLRSLSNFVFSC